MRIVFFTWSTVYGFYREICCVSAWKTACIRSSQTIVGGFGDDGFQTDSLYLESIRGWFSWVRIEVRVMAWSLLLYVTAYFSLNAPSSINGI